MWGSACVCPSASFISFSCLLLCTFCLSVVLFGLLYSFVLICAPLYFWSKNVSAYFSNMRVCAVSPSCFAMVIAFRISLYCFCFCLWRYVAMVCVCRIMFCLRISLVGKLALFVLLFLSRLDVFG